MSSCCNHPQNSCSQSQHAAVTTEDNKPWRFEGRLGRGSTAIITKVKLLATNELLARKAYRHYHGRLSQNNRQTFENEVNIMRRLSAHRHVAKLHEVFFYERELSMLISPVASDGDLSYYIHLASDGPTPEQESVLRRAFGCLASALTDIHKQRIRHKDIKPQNILVHHGQVIYTDFGGAYDAENQETTTTGHPGSFTRRYAAPEVIEYDNYPTSRSRKSDVYSLGCVFLEILDVLHLKLDLTLSYGSSYYTKLGPVRTLLLQSAESVSDHALFQICHDMIAPEQENRIDAATALGRISALCDTDEGNRGTRHFCNECLGSLSCKSRCGEVALSDGVSKLMLEDRPTTKEEALPIVELPTLPNLPEEVRSAPELVTAIRNATKKHKVRNGIVSFAFHSDYQTSKSNRRAKSSIQRSYCTLCGSLGHESSNCPNECWACGELYHKSADCPNKCWTCDEAGHYARDCPNECDACDEVGHTTEECPNKCWTCGEVGHFAQNCPDPCFICGKLGHDTLKCRGKCHGCGKVGHWRRDCDDACFECGELGHWAAQCPKRKKKSRRVKAQERRYRSY